MQTKTSRIRTLRTVLFAMFALERGQPISSVLLFVWSVLTLSWFSNSSTDLLGWFGSYLLDMTMGCGAALSSGIEPLKKPLIPTFFLLATITGLYLNYRRNREPDQIVGIAAEPHPGLIA